MSENIEKYIKEREVKNNRLEKINKCLKRLDIVAKACYVTAVISGLAYCSALIGITSLSPDKSDLVADLKANQDMALYENYVEDEMDKAYLQYKNGEISVSDFSSRCNYLKGDNSLIEYSKGLKDNSDITEILSEYQTKEDNVSDIRASLGFGGIAGAGGAAIGIGITRRLTSGYKRKRENLEYELANL